jgi:DnaK suppressor protein
VEEQRARDLLRSEREQIERLLAEVGRRDAVREAGDEHADRDDGAQPMTADEADETVASGLRARLSAISRAEARLDAGTYGLSVKSGDPIPDERLEADPAAELTVQEAAAVGR